MLFALIVHQKRPPTLPSCSPAGTSYAAAWDVAVACWQTNPSERITMADARDRLLEESTAGPDSSSVRRHPPSPLFTPPFGSPDSLFSDIEFQHGHELVMSAGSSRECFWGVDIAFQQYCKFGLGIPCSDYTECCQLAPIVSTTAPVASTGSPIDHPVTLQPSPVTTHPLQSEFRARSPIHQTPSIQSDPPGLCSDIDIHSVHLFKRIGGGGFGTVYVLPHATAGKAAVKRLVCVGNHDEMAGLFRVRMFQIPTIRY